MIKVAHICNTWLQTTTNWMFTQLRHLPSEIKRYVICGKTMNLDQYAVPNMHVYEDHTPVVKRYADNILLRAGIYRRPAFFSEIVRNIGAQVIHSHYGIGGWHDIPLALRSKAKHVTTFYGHDVNRTPSANPKWQKRYHELFSRGDLFLCEGPHMALCLEQLGCPREKIHVHHLGVDFSQIPFHPRKYVPGKELRVLIAAAFTEKKGIPYAIEALSRINKQFPLTLTIIGESRPNNHIRHMSRFSQYKYRLTQYINFMRGIQPVDWDEEKNKILAALTRTGLIEKTRLLGYQPHDFLLREAYNNHIFLSPSVLASDGDTEGGAPVAIIEMAASGMPVVSTHHCDIPEVLKYEENWLAEERDVDGLVRIIERWLHAPKDWDLRLAKQRLYLEKEFNATVQGTRLANVYKRICLEKVP